MTRPRKPFGSNHPGRLPATMMKVLAAEMTDPSRLRRGKQYANDGSVLDIVIDPGTVTCEIQGSRSVPYIAVLAVRPGDGMPLRRDVRFTCTCPDDGNWDDAACKHVVATMFALSDEFLLEPELLDVWRGRTTPDDGVQLDDDRDQDDELDERLDHRLDRPDSDTIEASTRRRRHLRLVGSDQRSEAEHRRDEPRADPLADLLRVPHGGVIPDIGPIERTEPVLPRSRELAAAFREALANLRIEWD